MTLLRKIISHFRRRRRPLPEWAHGRQTAGLAFMVVECTNCHRQRLVVATTDDQQPKPSPCLQCARVGSRPPVRRVSDNEAWAFVQQFGAAPWITLRGD